MLWTVLVVLLILWILGFSFQVAGNLIHLLLVVALIVLVLQLRHRTKALKRAWSRGLHIRKVELP